MEGHAARARGRRGDAAQPSQSVNFITVNGTRFMDGCREFFVAGINVDNIVEAAIPAVSSRKVAPGVPTGRQMVSDLLSSAAASDLNLLRTWAHTTDPSHPLQISPGVYSEEVFQALDYVIAEAGKVGMRVTLSLVDTWRYRGGISEFLDWSATAPHREPEFPPLVVQGDVTPEMMTPEREAYEAARRALFYSDPGSRTMYKAHMETILTRVNTFTGIKYSQDPTIFSFGLLNEPRCDTKFVPGCTAALQGWLQEMARGFRALDPVHLLTIGEEGFWGAGSAAVAFNPGAASGSVWAAETGQDFVMNHNITGISYAAIHVWPDNWQTHDAEFMVQWLEHHAKDAAGLLGMPLLLEEMGKKVNPAPGSPAQLAEQRDPVYGTMYRTVERSIASGGALKGSLLWELDFRIYEESPPSPYGVRREDSTYALVAQHAQRVKAHALRLASQEGCKGAEGPDAGCWVGEVTMLGVLRRCVRRPEACSAVGAAGKEEGQGWGVQP